MTATANLHSLPCVDARHLHCPQPLLMASRALRALPKGAALIVRGTDKAAPRDIQAWATSQGHRLEILHPPSPLGERGVEWLLRLTKGGP
ncbi:sulfurtransferase TusA family protein [Formicincola oecophyllae]|uniref:Sulfurtransferase TusA family protein n=1 Tax=Formicincola oecophyllae TaxID=2558361 RepID=A0A4Y6U6S2_9PROT|nr:sulfurtransferase TusA family protein [Formicincola oecophyllae]QDH13069.1 sulfurtransferase TusA family protein [Formicincola oecophyllae]